MSEPYPVRVEVCSVCGEGWNEHLSLVRYYDDETDEELYEHVDVEHCVTVLKNRFRGPVGPVGPMGAAGMNAVAS